MWTAGVLSGPHIYVAALSILGKVRFTGLWETKDGTGSDFKNRIANRRVLKRLTQAESVRDAVEA